jgi:tRNA (cmo5U34)-methyltransferase
MSHSVRKHLRVDIDAYDDQIRRFIPGYEAMLRAAALAVASVQPGLVLDLGAGTGGLSEMLLRQERVGHVELLDVDPEMLERARARLAAFGWRARFRERSFLDPLPSCDAVAASLSLHHVRAIEAKRELYGRVFDALWGGGIFVNADATMPTESKERDALYRHWVDHMVASGIEERDAWSHFEEWAEEDTYQPLDDEMAALVDAGFDVECVWREGPMTVVVGRKG